MTPEQICSTYDFWIIVRRWMATWIDFLLFLVVLGVLAAAGQRQPAAAVVISLLFGLLYYPVLEGLAGFTVGKLLCGLRVVDADGRPPGLLKGILRTVARLVDVNPLLMGALPAGIAVLTSKSRQRLGDMLAKTWVLKTEDFPFLGAAAPVPAASWQFPTSPQWPPPDPAVPPTWPSYSYPPGQPAAVPAYGYPPPPSGRVAPLPTSNRTWPLPGALLASVGTVVLVWWGIADGKRVAAQPPVSMTFAAFRAAAPKEGYYRITGSQLDVANAVYLKSSSVAETDSDTKTDSGTGTDSSAGGDSKTATESTEEIRTIYVPVLNAGDKTGEPTPLVLETDNDTNLKTFRAMNKLTDATVEAWLQKHGSETEVRREIRGTLQGEFSLSEDERKEIARSLGKQVTPGLVVLKEGDTPTAVASIFAIVVGVVSGILAGLFWLVSLINFAATPTRRGAA